MNLLSKKVRYYRWLTSAFISKNLSFIIISTVFSFIIIFLFLSFYPTLNSLLFRKKQIIGYVGRYKTTGLPVDITNQISGPLVAVDMTGEITPVIADSWEMLKDKKTYRIHLRDNLIWDDKKDFTAYDIKFNVSGVSTKVIDDNTIDFVLDQPLMIFPVYLTKPLIKKPLHGISGIYSVQGLTTDKKNFVKIITLSPNKKGVPFKIYKFYNTEEELITAYKKGEINKFSTNKESVSRLFTKWQNTRVSRSVDFTKVMTLFFNNNSSHLQNRDIRKAIVFATEKFEGKGEPASGPIPPSSWAYYPNVKQYAFNLERAHNALNNNGKEGGEKINLTLHTFFDYADIAEKLKSNYEKIGFKIDLKLLSYVPDEFDLLLTMWEFPKDPDQYFFWHSTQKNTNLTSYKNVKIDKLLEDGRSVINVQQRKNVYRDFQKVLAEDLPAYFLYYPFEYEISRR